MSENLLLHYDNISEFKDSYYKKLLTPSNLQDSERYFKNVIVAGGDEQEFNRFCFVLEKGGRKFLLESKHKSELPIMVTHAEKIAYRGDAYYLIKKFSPARFKPERAMSFKEFVDTLSAFSHSNPDGYKLYWIMALAQMMDRVNYRISTPPAFGKDGVVDICGHLFGQAATIENPTRAKLEYMTAVRWLAVNEVVDITSDKWKDVEQFLLQVGAMKPTVTKSSRSMGGSTGEMLDLTKFSISLMYNDIDRYPKKKKYFDFVSSDQLRDRFFPVRFWGTLKHDFNAIRGTNIEEFVGSHKHEYEALIRTFVYYEENYEKELKHYSTTNHSGNIKLLRDRWKTNVGRIMKFIDLYSPDQETFDKYCKLLFSAHQDYNDMTEYPLFQEDIEKKKKQIIYKDYKKFKQELNSKQSFSEKKKIINKFLSDEQVVAEDTSFW